MFTYIVNKLAFLCTNIIINELPTEIHVYAFVLNNNSKYIGKISNHT